MTDPDLLSTPLRRRSLGALIALLSLGAAGCASTGTATSNPGAFRFVAPGGQTTLTYDPPAERGRAGDIRGENLAEPGTELALADFTGQVVVLNVWGSWCAPCREEAPGLQQVYEFTRERGVVVLGIDVRDQREAAADFMRDRGLTYPSIYDFPGRSLTGLSGFPLNIVPATIVLDRDHRVAAIFLRAVRVAELLPVVERVAAEVPAPDAAEPGPAPTSPPPPGEEP